MCPLDLKSNITLVNAGDKGLVWMTRFRRGFEPTEMTAPIGFVKWNQFVVFFQIKKIQKLDFLTACAAAHCVFLSVLNERVSLSIFPFVPHDHVRL